MVRRIQLRTLRSKLLVAFAVLGLLPLVVLGVLSTREALQTTERLLGNRLSARARIIGDDIKGEQDDWRLQAELFSELPLAVVGTPDQVAALADKMLSHLPSYDLVVVADREGSIIATNSRTGDQKPVDRSRLLGRSVRGQPWFDTIASGRTSRGHAFAGEPATDPLVAAVSTGGGRGVTYSVGIYDEQGQLVRVWSNHISWARTIGALLEVHLAGMQATNQTTATLDLIDSTGVVLDRRPVQTGDPAPNLVAAGSQVAKHAVALEIGLGHEVDPRDGHDDLIGYAPVPAGAEPAARWSVLVHQTEAEIVAAGAGVRNFAILVAICAALFIVLGALLVARTLSRPLRGVAAALARVATGDLTARAEIRGEDEIAQMTRALHTALDKLSAAFATIGAGVDALARSSEELTSIGSTMGASAEATSQQAGVVAAASEQAGKNIHTVASGTEEMSVTVKEIAKNAADAARVATTAVSQAQLTTELVGKLGRSSDEIGNVLKVITSIAEQTNLLALNATIEAARAGEAGKGFAVVANEVKELAKETARATEDIGKKIATIQADTGSAVSAIGEITIVIGQINDIQGTIASSVEEQAATTNEIGRNMAELAQASGEIARNVTSVAGSAGATADCSSQTRAAATSLADLARSLDLQMQQFHYDRDLANQITPAAHRTTGTLVRVPPAISLGPIPVSSYRSAGRH